MAQKTLRRRFVRLAEARVHLDERERNLVIEARQCGWTWDELAKELGLTRQGVRSRYKDLPGRDVAIDITVTNAGPDARSIAARWATDEEE